LPGLQDFAVTKLLDNAIERIRELAEAEQDEAAEILLVFASKPAEPVYLDDETRAAVREGRAQAKRGQFVPDEDMAKLARPGNE
jgi:predicted transcriptional regulator